MPSRLEWLLTGCCILQELLTSCVQGVNYHVGVSPLLEKWKLFVGEAQHLPELLIAQLNKFLDAFLPVCHRDIHVQYDFDLFRVCYGLNIFQSCHNILTNHTDIISNHKLV